MDRLLVIIGPSGAGKSTILKRLVDTGVAEVLPTWTTRPPRPEERGGTLEHVFCTAEEFSTAKARGKFIHTDKAFGLDYEYGLPVPSPLPGGRVLIVMLRIMVLEPLFTLVKDPTIYQIEAPETRASEILGERQMSGDDLGSRLINYVKEMEAGRRVATRVFVNEDIKKVTSEMLKAIKKDFDIPKK